MNISDFFKKNDDSPTEMDNTATLETELTKLCADRQNVAQFIESLDHLLSSKRLIARLGHVDCNKISYIRAKAVDIQDNIQQEIDIL